MKVKDYKELKVWQKGIEIVDKIYSLTEDFPRNEQYGLSVQMRKAAVSIPSNIAEGFARHHTKEYVQFLYIALGSCAELETQILIAQRRKYVVGQILEELFEDINHQNRMLMKLIQALNGSRVTRHEALI